MRNLCLIMHATDTIFVDKVSATFSKLHVKFQPDPLRSFKVKVGKVKIPKNHA